ncbi:efflux RND transporter periplasmic adaptor subunit [Neptunicella marina]|uniref:Efflux RND transporter periplasmic adaptor subunit n=1 Tax=Neptunicella marina TaxID=2125989 RepID=A0A8J6M2X2_9ALTE|nr:efflux RND transporter periplasmic adaptor subunit [Neptunicella marina]MBC3764871.1 efflux RND transporter periplasmic adaptor subunit [Neptunicella marina]
MSALRIRSFLPIIIILAAVVVLIALVAMKKPPEKKPHEDKAFLVDVQAVQMQNLDFEVKSQGTVIPRIKTILSAQVSGKIVKVSPEFIEGGMFKQGDVLVQLEQSDFITDVKAAEAELARAQALLEEEQARGKVAEEDWRTVKNLTPTELGLRKPQLAQEKASVRAAEANLERARRNLERTSIKAPFDGLVASKNADLGQFITTGSQLGLIYATDVAEVRLPLSDNDMAYLDIPAQSSQGGLPDVTLTANVAGKLNQWKGSIVRSEGIVDEQSRVIYVVARVDDPYARESSTTHLPLKFGRFVQASITGVQASNIVTVPRHVLRIDGSVLLMTPKRELEIREVNVQRTDKHFAYISSGLAEGENIIVSAVPHPVNGMKLRLADDKPQHPASADKEQEEQN